jgi:hypothetical protein
MCNHFLNLTKLGETKIHNQKNTYAIGVLFFSPPQIFDFGQELNSCWKKEKKNSHFLKNSLEKSGFFEDLFQNKLYNKTKINQDPRPPSPTQ